MRQRVVDGRRRTARGTADRLAKLEHVARPTKYTGKAPRSVQARLCERARQARRLRSAAVEPARFDRGAEPHMFSSIRTRKCRQQLGDTNADCVFDVNDVRFVTQYLAYRGIAFTGATGQTIKTTLSTSSHSSAALDADHNGDVSGKDASFLNKINLGIFFFVEHLAVAEAQACSITLTFQIFSKGDGAVPLDTSAIYLDVAHNGPAGGSWPTPVAEIGSVVTATKGSQGALLKAACVANICTVRFHGDFWGVDAVGVSVIQVTKQPNADVMIKPMMGSDSAPFEINEPLRAGFGGIRPAAHYPYRWGCWVQPDAVVSD